MSRVGYRAWSPVGMANAVPRPAKPARQTFRSVDPAPDRRVRKQHTPRRGARARKACRAGFCRAAARRSPDPPDASHSLPLPIRDKVSDRFKADRLLGTGADAEAAGVTGVGAGRERLLAAVEEELRPCDEG